MRPARRQAMLIADRMQLSVENGLVDDRYDDPSGKRQVSLIQKEHLDVVATLLGLRKLDPTLLRRNLVVSGINLLAFENKPFQIGNVLLHGTGLCKPCAFMEESLGHGGYNAMIGHGGIIARVLEPGTIILHDTVSPATQE